MTGEGEMEEAIPTTENSSNEAAAPSSVSAGDVSNKTIGVLVILTVIISILGTIVTFNEMQTAIEKGPPAQAKSFSAAGSSGGKVSLTIKERQEPVQGTGMVTLEILPS